MPKGHRLRELRCLLGFALVTCSVAAQQANDPVVVAAGLVKEGKYHRAVTEVERSLRNHAGEPSRLLTIEGIAYSMMGNDAAALKSFDRALHMNPKSVATLRAKAQVEVRGHHPGAIDVLNQLLIVDPSDTTAREMLAVEQARSGECEQAVANFEGLHGQIEAHAESLLRYGACLFNQHQDAAAIDEFHKLLSAHPDSRDARYDLALVQMHAGDSRGTLTTLAPLLGDGADGDTLSLAADAAEANGDTPQAVALLRRAIVLDPMVPDHYVRFVEVCLEHESYSAGIEMVTAGLLRLPREPGLYLARGMLYGGKADYVKAEADFRVAESLDPKHGIGAYGVGLVQAQDHHPEQAMATAREALKTHPDDGQLQLLLARLQMEAGQQPGSPGFAEALHAAEAAVRLRPDLTAAHDVLSKAYMLQGDMQKVIVECRISLGLDPDDTTARYRLMIASRKVGDTETVKTLARELSDDRQKARNAETERLRYRIEAAPAHAAPSASQP